MADNTSSNDPTSDSSFEQLWERLTSTQRRYVVERQNHITQAATAESLGMHRQTVYNWPSYVEEAAERLVAHRVDAIRSGLEEAAMEAIMRLPQLVGSNDEKVAIKAVQYAIDQAAGKATQPSEVTHSGEIDVESDTIDDVLDHVTGRAERLGDEE